MPDGRHAQGSSVWRSDRRVGWSHEQTDLVQEYLRGIRTSLEGLHQKVDGLTERMGNVEQSIAHLYANVAEQ